MLGLAAVIVQEGLQDVAFTTERAVGFEAITGVLRGVELGEMAQRCGISEALIRSVARAFAAADRAAIEIDLGLEQSRFNTLTAYLTRLIMALTGNLGRVGGSVFVSTFVPRVRKRPPESTAPVSGIPGIALFAPAGMFSPNLFAEETLRDDPGRIRAAIIEGSNPVLSYADTPRTTAALDALELRWRPAWASTS